MATRLDMDDYTPQAKCCCMARLRPRRARPLQILRDHAWLGLAYAGTGPIAGLLHAARCRRTADPRLRDRFAGGST